MNVDKSVSYRGYMLIVRGPNGQLKGKAWPDDMAKEVGLASIEFDAGDVEAPRRAESSGEQGATFSAG